FNLYFMSLSKERIDEFKKIYKEKFNKELTDAEASESANNLVGFFELLWKSSLRDMQREEILKKEPKGFHIADGIYNCMVCRRTVTGDESWYDQWGVKCLLCQKAVEDGTIPGFVCTDHDSHYKTWELKDKFKIHPQTARKMVRLGELKARIVTTEKGEPYEYIFLKKENPQLICRYSPERKSYDRHRKKESERLKWEWKKKERKKIKTSKNTSQI
ncbi:MAG: hypothetical protein NTU76_00865, partial [Candidatus Taylorbacteria bacterium]|nr:hypothetical protein [Candidatus Taylorbacteria bacterium]